MSGYIGNIPTPQATQTRETFTATASQTTFNTAGYTPGFVDVWLNGVKLVNGDDFTATNGSDVVLTVGAASGDTVEVLSFSTFEVNSQTFTGDTSAVNLNVTGTFTSRGIDDNADATAITIDSSENVLVGQTASTNPAGANIAGISLGSDGLVSAGRDWGDAAIFGRRMDDGSIVSFTKDGTTVGSIGTDGSSGDFYVQSQITNHAGLGFKVNEVLPRRNGYVDGIDNLGSSSYRWANLYLSGGVYLGGTGAANLLDDYEEGTWTPVISGTGGNPTVSYSVSPSGDYTKIGSLVFLRFDMTITSISGGSGFFEMSGVPFLSSGFPGWSNGIIRNSAGIGVSAQTSHIGFWPSNTSGKLVFEVMSSSSSFTASLMNISAVQAGRITGVITYRTA